MSVLKRIFDFLFAVGVLLISSPVLLVMLFLVWLQDYHSPIYRAPRVGMGGRLFRMSKIRSMVVAADKTGVVSTSANDPRITTLGHFIRRYKIDELAQFWNVLTGHMSVVGPRPQLETEVALYTEEEKKLLQVKPGITDFASIVFADEGEILKGRDDPNLAYHQLIRPWKSRLGIFYTEKQSLWLDFRLVFCTGLVVLSRRRALARLQRLLMTLGADDALVSIVSREKDLCPAPPPGTNKIVTQLPKVSQHVPG